MLLTLDGTFLVQIINFVVFWVLLNYLFIAPTRRAIEERQRVIAQTRRAAEECAHEAGELRAQAEAILDEARRTTAENLRVARAQASNEAVEIERRAAEEAAATVQLAHATVASERSQAVAKQAPFVADLARAMVQRATAADGAA